MRESHEFLMFPDVEIDTPRLMSTDSDFTLVGVDDLATVAERVNEPTVPHAKVVAELRDDGYLSD